MLVGVCGLLIWLRIYGGQYKSHLFPASLQPVSVISNWTVLATFLSPRSVLISYLLVFFSDALDKKWFLSIFLVTGSTRMSQLRLFTLSQLRKSWIRLGGRIWIIWVLCEHSLGTLSKPFSWSHLRSLCAVRSWILMGLCLQLFECSGQQVDTSMHGQQYEKEIRDCFPEWKSCSLRDFQNSCHRHMYRHPPIPMVRINKVVSKMIRPFTTGSRQLRRPLSTVPGAILPYDSQSTGLTSGYLELSNCGPTNVCLLIQ